MTRGFFGIGIEHGKTVHNTGTLWRSANILGASWIFTIGRRYKQQASDTLKTWRHIPLLNFASFEDMYAHIPHDCRLVGVELDPHATPIAAYAHPERCIYLLGAEDNGLTAETRRRCHALVQLPGRFCMNVAAAGTVVMYDRHAKERS